MGIENIIELFNTSTVFANVPFRERHSGTVFMYKEIQKFSPMLCEKDLQICPKLN
jgi:hypothetical protein